MECTCLYQVYLSTQEANDPNRKCSSQRCPSNKELYEEINQSASTSKAVGGKVDQKESNSTLIWSSDEYFVEKVQSLSDSQLQTMYRYKVPIRAALAESGEWLQFVYHLSRKEKRELRTGNLSLEEIKMIQELREKKAEEELKKLRKNPKDILRQFPAKKEEEDENDEDMFLGFQHIPNERVNTTSVLNISSAGAAANEERVGVAKKRKNCKSEAE